MNAVTLWESFWRILYHTLYGYDFPFEWYEYCHRCQKEFSDHLFIHIFFSILHEIKAFMNEKIHAKRADLVLISNADQTEHKSLQEGKKNIEMNIINKNKIETFWSLLLLTRIMAHSWYEKKTSLSHKYPCTLAHANHHPCKCKQRPYKKRVRDKK